MATVGHYNFPFESRLDGEFAAWSAEAVDRLGSYIEASDSSVFWLFLDSDLDETNPVGVRIIDPDVTVDTAIDRDVQTIDGRTVRMRDALALAQSSAA